MFDKVNEFLIVKDIPITNIVVYATDGAPSLNTVISSINLIEVGITSQDRLKQVEKCHKYDILAGELSILYHAQVKIIPLVLTWDGLVSKFYKNYVEKLAIEDATQSYIQSVVLKKTLIVEHMHGIRITDEINSASSLLIEASHSYEDNMENEGLPPLKGGD
ncbi:uncharacterized protein LOC115230812 [Octopus sinensis]|uniref:Uncharacterized protein LOC115230812 n=1 Tax=Octopus sinensis TaxID=2607531 RepID=A0A6P7U5L5_9MOLL|nr:uncharacterized protein LOC115230812 [Octopus sinensis]